MVETGGHSTNLPFVSFPQENTLTGFGGATLSLSEEADPSCCGVGGALDKRDLFRTEAVSLPWK